MSFKWEKGLDIDQRISKNIKNMIETEKGELAYDRELGVSTGWKDKPVYGCDAKTITEITEMCNEREPRAVTEVTAEEDGKIKVVYQDA